MQKIKYITNRDLLAEIQNSKNTYCYFIAPEYAVYDVIVSSIADVTPALLETVIASKATKLTGDAEDIASIVPEQVVFRVMSDAHLPSETDEKRRIKSSRGDWVTKPNFPSFSHVVLRDGVICEVGRSHWRGGLENGHFDLHSGYMTNQLAAMFMLLVERYSRGGSWRAYCVDEQTEALTQRGWLTMHEITEQDVILSYDAGRLKWSKIKSIFRGHYDGLMFHLTIDGMNALVTPRHRFLTDRGLIEVEYLIEKDRVILMGDPADGGAGDYSDAFVELVGRIVADGSYALTEARHYEKNTIYQDEGPKADRIRACLSKLEVRFSESKRGTYTGHTQVAFSLTKQICLRLAAVAPDRVLEMAFILALSQPQRELLIDTMVDGNRGRTKFYGPENRHGGVARYSQTDKRHMDAFLALCTISGHRTSTRLRNVVSFGKRTTIYDVNIFSKLHDRHRYSLVENIDFHGGKRDGGMHPGYQNEPTVPYNGRIWCPETEYGTFIARRAGTIFAMGNSYNDEMRSHALTQLAQVGLQFNEMRSANPFAFYTQIIKNCFRRILNLEHRAQTIRDDLLIMSGAMPSYTRQVDNEMDQRDESNDNAAKRGRKPKSINIE